MNDGLKETSFPRFIHFSFFLAFFCQMTMWCVKSTWQLLLESQTLRSGLSLTNRFLFQGLLAKQKKKFALLLKTYLLSNSFFTLTFSPSLLHFTLFPHTDSYLLTILFQAGPGLIF